MRLSFMAIPAAALIAFGAAGCSQNTADNGSFTSYVNTKIGTGGHGHVFVGANVPFGLVQLGPTSIPQSWDWCSGYHESDSTVIGFSHTHLIHGKTPTKTWRKPSTERETESATNQNHPMIHTHCPPSP